MFSKVSVEIQFYTVILDSRVSITPTKAVPHLTSFRTEADAWKITHVYKANVIYDNLRHEYDKNHIPLKVIVPPPVSSALKWISRTRSFVMDSNTGTNETDFIKRFLI